jgi:predicted nucleotidyltransferase
MQKLTIDQIKEKALPILKEAGIKRSSLFGSYVRGEQRDDSDVDLLVEYPEHTSLFDVVALKNRLEETLGKSVDLVGFNSIKPRLKQYILPEQLPIL